MCFIAMFLLTIDPTFIPHRFGILDFGLKENNMATKKIKNRIAIACQGGGSHTAFTAGVLKKILSQRNKLFSNDKYKHIEVRRIRMLRDLNYSTKLERRLVKIEF